VNTVDPSYVSTLAHTTFSPHTIGSEFFKLSEFGFGLTDTNAQTEYYHDLLNSDNETYGV